MNVIEVVEQLAKLAKAANKSKTCLSAPRVRELVEMAHNLRVFMNEIKTKRGVEISISRDNIDIRDIKEDIRVIREKVDIRAKGTERTSVGAVLCGLSVLPPL